MILTTSKKMTKNVVATINTVARGISMTISSLGPRSVPSNIVGDNLVTVQRLGGEIGINNLPTSARQLKHKVIKACETCFKLELTSKYNFKTSLEKTGTVLCRKCSQSTPSEHERRSENQKRLHADPTYRQRNSVGMVKSAKQQTSDKIERHCRFRGIELAEFTGFSEHEQPYPSEFNRKLKDEVKRRDLHECKLCKGSGKPLDIHHVDFDKFNCHLTNLVALCKSCHAKITRRGPNCDLNHKLMI